MLPHLLPQFRTDEWQDAPLPLLAQRELAATDTLAKRIPISEGGERRLQA